MFKVHSGGISDFLFYENFIFQRNVDKMFKKKKIQKYMYLHCAPLTQNLNIKIMSVTLILGSCTRMWMVLHTILGQYLSPWQLNMNQIHQRFRKNIPYKNFKIKPLHKNSKSKLLHKNFEVCDLDP